VQEEINENTIAEKKIVKYICHGKTKFNAVLKKYFTKLSE
jgi:hypothetical protein